MLRTTFILLLATAPALAAPPAAAPAAPPACPDAVTKAVKAAFAKATIGACKAEREHGKDQFEVVLTKADGSKVEVDVAPDGTILQVEEKIAVDALPEAVKKAFAAKYPKARADAAEKQTAGKDVRYEIAFQGDNGRKEATFAADGKFIEEE
jgi:ribosomal protein L7/L12